LCGGKKPFVLINRHLRYETLVKLKREGKEAQLIRRVRAERRWVRAAISTKKITYSEIEKGSQVVQAQRQLKRGPELQKENAGKPLMTRGLEHQRER